VQGEAAAGGLGVDQNIKQNNNGAYSLCATTPRAREEKGRRA
jgi:hypothetical protein